MSSSNRQVDMEKETTRGVYREGRKRKEARLLLSLRTLDQGMRDSMSAGLIILMETLLVLFW